MEILRITSRRRALNSVYVLFATLLLCGCATSQIGGKSGILGEDVREVTAEIKRRLRTENEEKRGTLHQVARPGGCPEGNPCPNEGECFDIKPVGDGIGWDGSAECAIPIPKKKLDSSKNQRKATQSPAQ